jgi:thiol-disulfide isomerase/thioredoxin
VAVITPLELHFIYADGCGACEAAKPMLKEFQRKYPLILVKRVDLLSAPWPEGGWAPTATPTYLAVAPGRQPVGYVGGMTVEQIEQFVRLAAPKLGLPVPL